MYNSGCVNRRRRVRKGSLGTCKKTGKAYVRLYRARQQKTQTNIVGDVLWISRTLSFLRSKPRIYASI